VEDLEVPDAIAASPFSSVGWKRARG